MRFLFLIPMLGTACTTLSHPDDVVQRRPANQVVVDEKFIENSVGKPFVHVRPEQADGEPNCVAAAFRAGGYLPAFAVNGTDSMYDRILPICFRKKATTESPAKGDLGTVYADKVPTLAHMVLFIDSDRVFEKPGPQNEQTFRYNSWSSIRTATPAQFSVQIWTYDPSINCPLEEISRDFNTKPDFEKARLVAREIDRRIYNSDWTQRRTFDRKQLMALIETNERKLVPLFKGKKFNVNTSFPAYYKISFISDVFKTLLRTPADK